MTTSTRKTPAKKTAARSPGPDVALVDRAIAEANVDESSFPVMIGIHQLPRRRKAEMLDALQRVNLEDIDVLMKAAADGSVEAAAKFWHVLADLEDMLAAFALDEDAFRMWAEASSEVELMALMSRTVTEAGEASSSSS